MSSSVQGTPHRPQFNQGGVLRYELPTTLAGVAGEYFVAAELTRLGFIATITLRNTLVIDFLASDTLYGLMQKEWSQST